MMHSRSQRRGTILVMVLVLFAVSTMIVSAIVLRLLSSQRQLSNSWQHEQAWWMAQSELDRLQVLSAAGALTQQPPREWIVDGRTLQVRISLAADADPAPPAVTIEVLDPNQTPAAVLIRRTADLRYNDNREATPEEPGT